MRARPREVNIFNMSLLDILCGALGAFCFMMLVALPYYVSATVDRARSQQRTEELLKDIEKLRERMSDPAQAEDLRRMVDELTGQIKQLEGQVNQYAYENDQLKKQNDELVRQTDQLKKDNEQYTATDKKQRTLIAQRKPTAVLVTANNLDQEVDLYLEDDLVEEGKDKSANPPFDPAKKWHESNWANDITEITEPDRGYRVWIASQTVAGAHYRLFVNEGGEPQDRRTTGFGVLLFGDFPKARFAAVGGVVLGPQRPWDLVGTISVDDNWKISFTEASQPERDAEWRKRNLTPPPVPKEAPAKSAPAATPAATPIDRAAMEAERQRGLELRKKREEAQRRKEQQQSGANTASPSTSPQATKSPERPRTREESEQLLKRQQSRPSPAPSAAPTATP